MTTANERTTTNQENLLNLQQELDRLAQCLENAIAGKNPQDSPPSTLLETTAFGQLCRQFHLSAFDRDILLLCLGSEIDRAIPLLIAKAQGDEKQNYPTLNLAVSIFPQATWSVLSPQNPLQQWKMLEFAPGFCLTQTAMRLDPRILCYLLGVAAIDEQLAEIVRFPHISAIALPPSQEKIAQQMIATWTQVQSELPILQLCGSDSGTKMQLVTHLCHQLGYSFGILSCTSLPTNPHELHQLKQRWQREAILGNRLLVLDCDNPGNNDPGNTAALRQIVETLQTPAILSSRDRLFFPQRNTISFEIPPLDYREQKTLWETHLGPAANQLNGEMSQLIAQFNLNSTTIKAACHSIANPKTDLSGNLWNFCRTQARPRLDELAQRIDSSATWDDLILPELQKEVLQDLWQQLQHRAKVYHDWGFGTPGTRGLGITALFHGSSGTGKTLAAEVLANHCNLDLYRIDLSAVVSKYIGETEKNLARIFDAASVGGAILLFDEADALFGKRTEVKDSHDRHANVEVSYLLQRMEAYQGLAILTTNYKNSLDVAFLRRIRFMVEFPFPKAEQRSAIWQRSFPSNAPTEKLNYKKLGNLQVAGGSIKNIAINAAFLAAAEGDPIQMKHILRSTERECLKLQRTLTNSEIKNWV